MLRPIGLKKSLLSLLATLIVYQWGTLFAGAATDPLAVIVNKANGASELSTGRLAGVYRGEMEHWPNQQKIVVLNRPITSEVRRQFYAWVLGREATAKFFRTGSPVPFRTQQVKSDRATRKMVARIPGAIGYIPLSAVDDSVKVLKIDGMLPDQARYPFQ